METIFFIVTLFVFFGVLYVIGAFVTALILHVLAMKTEYNEKNFFNSWINTIYYITSILFVLHFFFPSIITSVLISMACISYAQQIDILLSEEKTDELLKNIFTS